MSWKGRHRSLSTRAIGVLRGRMVVVLHNCILPGSALRFSPGKDEDGEEKLKSSQGIQKLSKRHLDTGKGGKKSSWPRRKKAD